MEYLSWYLLFRILHYILRARQRARATVPYSGGRGLLMRKYSDLHFPRGWYVYRPTLGRPTNMWIAVTPLRTQKQCDPFSVLT